MYIHTDGKKYGTGAILQSSEEHKAIHQNRLEFSTAAPYDQTKGNIVHYKQPVKNQYEASMCGGELLAQIRAMYDFLIRKQSFQDYSEITVYSPNFAPGGGMSVSELENAASFTGMTKYQTVPTPLNCTEAEAESLSWQNTATLAEALLYTGLTITSVGISPLDVAAALVAYGNCGMCLGGENNGTWLSRNPVPPTVAGPSVWGHFMAFNPNIDAVPATAVYEQAAFQSWGAEAGVTDSEGNQGVQYFNEAYFNSGFIYDCFSFAKFWFETDMQEGSTIPDVKYLQMRLGILPSTPGFGHYGPITVAAVTAFQKARGIDPIGICGPMTRAALNAAW